MLEVSPDYTVPYWVTPESAVRIVAPDQFRAAEFGRGWKKGLQGSLEEGSERSKRLPYFAWISYENE